MNIKTTHFERAIFLSWYCSKGDCKFCYMSTQKNLIKDPKKAKRRKESILAEAIISKGCGWEVEFISGGYESYSINELVEIVKAIYHITGKKQWLNIGVLDKIELKRFLPYLEGYTGAVECITPKLRDEVCPSKPLGKIEQAFRNCDELKLKKAMTFIVGLGETIGDFKFLEGFIKKNNINRITFYSLNPQKGTIFTKSPDIKYYTKWIKMTRVSFPDLKIIAGAWHDKTEYFSRLLKAGADYITKFPAIKYFGTKQAKDIETQAKLANRRFIGTLTKLPNINWDKEVEKLNIGVILKEKIKIKLNQYIKCMEKNI